MKKMFLLWILLLLPSLIAFKFQSLFKLNRLSNLSVKHHRSYRILSNHVIRSGNQNDFDDLFGDVGPKEESVPDINKYMSHDWQVDGMAADSRVEAVASPLANEVDNKDIVAEHSEFRKGFHSLLSGELFDVDDHKGAVLMWAGVPGGDPDVLRGEVDRFLRDDPLVVNNIVANWEVFDMAKEASEASIGEMGASLSEALEGV